MAESETRYVPFRQLTQSVTGTQWGKWFLTGRRNKGRVHCGGTNSTLISRGPPGWISPMPGHKQNVISSINATVLDVIKESGSRQVLVNPLLWMWHWTTKGPLFISKVQNILCTSYPHSHTTNSIFINVIDSNRVLYSYWFYILFSSTCKLIISLCTYGSNWIAYFNGVIVFAHLASDTADIAHFISLYCFVLINSSTAS